MAVIVLITFEFITVIQLKKIITMAKSMPITSSRSQSLKASSDECLSQSSAGSSNKHRTIKQDKDKVHNQSNTTTAGISSSNNDAAADNGCNTHKKKKGPRRRLSLLLEQKIDIKMKRNSQREIQIDSDDDKNSSSSTPNDDEDDKDRGATRPGNSILRNGKFDSLFHEKQVDINALRIEDAVLAFIEDKKDKKQSCPPKEGKSVVPPSIHADRKKINATTTAAAAADNGRHNNSVTVDTSTSSDNIRKKKKKGGPRRSLSLLLDQKIQTKTRRSSLDEDDEDAFPVVHKPFAKDTTRQTVVHKKQPVTTKNVEDHLTSRKPKTRPRRRLSLLLDEKMKEKERRDSSLF